MSVRLRFAPLRSLNECFGADTFRLPRERSSPDQVASRIVHNLIYFQSNYFGFVAIWAVPAG